jgi:hypothetical protein
MATGPVQVDSGEDASAWTALASPSAQASIVAGSGSEGGAICLDFDLGRGRSHAIARRNVSIDLPDDYMFVFRIRGDAEPNTIEIKFISGENVWWRRLPDYEIPHDWTELRVSRPRISFAWGPAGGGMPSHLDAIEIAVVAGKGGKGRLWIDEIRVEPRDERAAAEPPKVSTSSNGEDASHLLDGNEATAWYSASGDSAPEVTLDFHQPFELGGLEIDYVDAQIPRAYIVDASKDASDWQEIRRFTRARGPTDAVYTPDVYARFVRLRYSVGPGRTIAIREIRPQPFEFSASRNGFAAGIAAQAPPGQYPRYFSGEQSYWTVVGVADGKQEALINEEGSVEVDAGAFTLEPFVTTDDGVRTWKDATHEVRLEDGYLPIPTVVRRDGDLTLAITAFASGTPQAGTLYVRYRATAATERKLGLVVALRPFQVLPPWQALNRTGGVSTLTRISRTGSTIHADDRRVVALSKLDAFGAAAFEEGDITAFLADHSLPSSAAVDDSFGAASAALAWEFDVSSTPRDVWIAVPWARASVVAADAAGAEKALAETRGWWHGRLDSVDIELPRAEKAWVESLRSNLAYVLINRDGPAIQPGSRTYERSWIRDGAMTSSALLELGLAQEAKEFLRWFSGFVDRDGRVPCCVDARGADPVAENDSYGEFIWGVAEVWRFTRDRAFVQDLWPRVKAAAGYMNRLRATRMTEAYRSGDRHAMYGLLPESISHEGYSARPVHSYWDQAFALRGFTDAAMLAGVVGDNETEAALAADRDEFEKDWSASIRAVIEAHHMDVAPASVELADFDPTSTAVSFLLGSDHVYPRDVLERSWEKYARELGARRDAHSPGVGYTGYELRNAIALMLVGRKSDALALLGWMVSDQRPPAWHQWPEISWTVPTEPQFLGDLPHTWIGSTYVHALRSLMVMERDEEAGARRQPPSLLIGAGIPLSWLDGGETVRGRDLPTWFGPVSVSWSRDQGATAAAERPVRIDIASGGGLPGSSAAHGSGRRFEVPEGGIEVAAPFGADVDTVTVDGVVDRLEKGAVRVRRLPATVVFQYKPPLEKPW